MSQTKKSGKKDAMTHQIASLLRKQSPQAAAPVVVPVAVPVEATVPAPVVVLTPDATVDDESKPEAQKAPEPVRPDGEGSSSEPKRPLAARSRREEPLEGVGGGPSMPVTIGINGETRRRLSNLIEQAKESSGIFTINISSAVRLCSIVASRAGVTLADVDQMLAEDNRRR